MDFDYVYFVDLHNGLIKIGKAVDVDKRLASGKTWLAKKPTVLAARAVPAGEGLAEERTLQTKFERFNRNEGGGTELYEDVEEIRAYAASVRAETSVREVLATVRAELELISDRQLLDQASLILGMPVAVEKITEITPSLTPTMKAEPTEQRESLRELLRGKPCTTLPPSAPSAGPDRKNSHEWKSPWKKTLKL